MEILYSKSTMCDGARVSSQRTRTQPIFKLSYSYTTFSVIDKHKKLKTEDFNNAQVVLTVQAWSGWVIVDKVSSGLEFRFSSDTKVFSRRCTPMITIVITCLQAFKTQRRFECQVAYRDCRTQTWLSRLSNTLLHHNALT